MANVIKLKRGSGSDPSATDLVIGEVAVRTDTGKLFTKKDNGTIAEISGAGGSDIFINTLSASSGSGGGSATFNGTATRFTLSNPPDVSAQQLLVSVNGVVQKPNPGTSPSTGFAVDGNDIIFAAAPETGASFFIVTYGTIGLGIPADNSVTSGKIADGAIVNADVNASAAIAGSKINPNFGSQDISTTGNLSLYGTNPTISFIDSNEDSDFRLFINAGKFKIQDASNSNADRFTVFTDGHIDIPGNLNCANGLDVTGEITATSHLDMPDNAQIKLGTGDDLVLHHDGSISRIQADTSHLYLKGVDITLYKGNSNEKFIHCESDAQVELYHNNNKKFETTSGGVSVTGNIAVFGTVDGVDIATRDTLFGGLTSSSGVLTDGVTATTQGASDNTTKVATTAFVSTAIGNLINGAPSALDTLNELAAAMNDDAAFSTTVTNSLATKLANIVEDTSPQLGGTLDTNGQDILFNGAQNISWDSSAADLIFNDYAKLNLGTDKDFRAYQDGNNTILQSSNTAGGVYLQGALVQIGSETGEAGVKFVKDSSVELYHNNNKKFETTSGGVLVTGDLELSRNFPSLTFTDTNHNSDYRITNADGTFVVHDVTNSADRVALDSSGNVGIGTTTPTTPDGSNADNPLNGPVLTLYGDSPAINLTSSTTGSDDYSLINFGRTGSSSNPYRAVIGYKQSDDILRINAQNKIQFLTGGDITSGTVMTIDDNDRVGIGTTSPQYRLDVKATTGKANLQIRTDGTGANDDAFLRMKVGGTTQDCFIDFGDDDDGDAGFIRYNHSNDFLAFIVNTSERMRINSLGSLLISTTGTSSVTGGSTNAKYFDANDGCRLMSGRSNTAAREHLVFFNPNGDVGDITTSGSGTTFNTSSDYRLKENQVSISDGITRLKTLKPYKFNWKVDTSTIVDGFFAHEVSTAVPEAVTGEKDATENCSNVVLDKDGKFLEKDVTEEQWNKGKAEDPATYPSDSTWSASYTKNVYQKIDHSKLVPLLTAALQEAIGKIETLETKVAALEAG